MIPGFSCTSSWLHLSRLESVNSYHAWDWGNLKFIAQECFILCIAVFLKYERFDVVEYLLKQRYYIGKDDSHGQSTMASFGVFGNHLRSLKNRSDRLNLRRLSLHADLIKERYTGSGISFNHIMQADFLLYLAEAMQGRRQAWWPETLVFKSFHGSTFEIFLRSESTEYFNHIAPMLDVKFKAELEPFVEAFKERGLTIFLNGVVTGFPR